jgi:phosphoglycolate phosphatase-like HAD superfamily hydrolase
MKISKIYVDMDGVLCNFEKRYTELYGHVSEQVRRSEFRKNFDDFIKTKQFATLEQMEDAAQLIDYLNSVKIPKQILSSTAYDEVWDTISEQKQHWLKAHRFVWEDPIFVPGKRHKYKYAQPDTIIIDDTYSVIEDWEKAGGIAIHHRNTSTTLEHLKSILGA